jgi:hypothetical protein
VTERLTHVFQAADEYDGGYGPVYPTLKQAQAAVVESESDEYTGADLTWADADEGNPDWPVWVLMANGDPTPITVHRWPIQYESS